MVLDERVLERECLALCLIGHRLPFEVCSAAGMDDWRGIRDDYPPLAAIVVHIGGRRMTDGDVSISLAELVADHADVPVVVVAEIDDLTQVLKAISHGAKGYIPTSVGIKVCIEAIALAIAGGTFVPASSLLSIEAPQAAASERTPSVEAMFTPRQGEVLDALRRGKANKIIAYDLSLRESTVKVHVRNIMRKLQATNRTEASYKINDLFPSVNAR